MIKRLLLIFLVSLWPFLGAWGAEVRTLPKSVVLTGQDGKMLVVNGRWAVKTAPERSSLPSANAVQVVCSRSARTCTEILALLYTAADNAMPTQGGNSLQVLTQEYSIVEWTGSTVVARAAPRAADLEIRVSLVDNSAERIARETGARRGTKTDPRNVEHWVLE